MNFNLKENSIVSNKPIVDMIETIEHFAQTQPSYPGSIMFWGRNTLTEI